MEIHFEIENRCLLNCRHCSSFAKADGKVMNYTIKDMITFLRIFPERKNIFLTGGEPLLHEEFDGIISSLKSELSDVSVGAFTTGIVTHEGKKCGISEKRAHSLAALGLNMCYFSVYSTQAKKHDWMTENEGSFALTLESIKNMCEQNIEVKINLVVTEKNRDEIGDVIELASSLGCTEVRLLKLINHGRAKKCWTEIGLTEQEYRETVMKYSNIYKNIKITASSCPDILPCRPFIDAKGCQAGSKLAYVTFEGNVFPCAASKNKECYKIAKLDDIMKLKYYFSRKTMINDVALCLRVNRQCDIGIMQ